MKRSFLLPVAAVVLSGLLLFSCTQSPEQNPIIQEKFQKLGDMAEEVDQLKGKIRDIQNDIDTITQDLMTLKQMPRTTGVSPTELEALKARLGEMDGEMSKLKSELSMLKKKAVSAVKSVETSKPKTSVSKPEPTPEPRKRGQYYTVKTGDTLKSLAEKFKTTPEKIREENHLPQNKELIAGIRLYIIPGD